MKSGKSETRFSAKEDPCKSLRDFWHEVLISLKAVKDDCNEKSAPQQEAVGKILNL